VDPEKIKIHPSWKHVLADSFKKSYFDEISARLHALRAGGHTIYPPGPLIFNAFNTTPFESVKVVILGQDPYHNPSEAMGLSFSVPKGVRVPPSLKNIFKELHSDLGCTIPSHGDLSDWARQGVFLLNAILTVERNTAGAHRNLGWQLFTDDVIHALSVKRKHIVFMLWGNFARNKRTLIDDTKHLILEAAHPSPLAGNAFMGCRHFSKANEYLISNGLKPVNWDIN
jgi:uracil-DNA glycosylase